METSPSAYGLWMNVLLRRTVGDGPLPALPFTAGRGLLIQLGKSISNSPGSSRS